MRVMHSPALYPAGVGIEVDSQPDGQYVKAEVIEPTAKLLVKKGVLRAFSIGVSRPKIAKDLRARGGRVVDGIISEVSLVDRPANRNCKFAICKRAQDSGDDPSAIFLNELELEPEFAKVVEAELAKLRRPELVKDGVGDDDEGATDNTDRCQGCAGKGTKDDGSMCEGCHGSGRKPAPNDQDNDQDNDNDGGNDDGSASDNGPDDANKGFNRDVPSGRFATSLAPASPGETRPSVQSLDMGRTVRPTTNAPGEGNVETPVTAGTPDPSTFDRGPLTEGQQAPSAGIVPDYAKMAEAAALKWGAELDAAQPVSTANLSGANMSITSPDGFVSPFVTAVTEAVQDAPAIAKRDMDPDVGGGVDRDKIPADDFAGKNRSFPIVTPGDVSDAASSIGRAGSDNYSSDELKSRIIAIAKRKGPSFVAELPESWKSDSDKKAEKMVNRRAAAFVLKRLHDATCPVYDWNSVVETYPALEGGLSSEAFSGKSAAFLLQLLSEEIADDGGLGANADDIASLGKAYATIQRYLDATHGETPEPLFADLRAQLHKDFMLANGLPTASVDSSVVMTAGSEPSNMPRPTDPPTPGAYRRPLITAGQSQATATANQSPTWPSGNHQPDPSDFDRQLITDGHEADSPANKGEETADDDLNKGADQPPGGRPSATDVYDWAMREASQGVLTELHDHISSVVPQFCRMGITPEPLLPSSSGSPNMGGHVADVTSAQALGATIKANVPELVKMAAIEIAEDLTAGLRAENATLKARIEELEGEPAPNGPNRGMQKRNTATPETSEEGTGEEDPTTALLYRALRVGDPVIRQQAATRLEKMGKPVVYS